MQQIWRKIKIILLSLFSVFIVLCFIRAGYEKFSEHKVFLLYGEVTEINADEDGNIVLTIENPFGSSLQIYTDSRTSVYRTYPQKEEIAVTEIATGDIISAENRRFSSKAKEIYIDITNNQEIQPH